MGKRHFFYLLVAGLYLNGFANLFNMGFWGLITLGTEVPRDNSIFLLAEGLIAVLVLAIGILFYWLNLRDAYKTGEAIDNGEAVISFKASFHNVMDRDYPYLMVSLGCYSWFSP